MTEPSTAFPPDVLDLFERTREVDIETRDADGARHSTIIWVVVTDGVPYVRSWRGARARWYREAIAAPDVAIVADGRRIGVRVVPATDPTSVEACSRGLASKYAGDPATPSMVTPAILDTTLRLEPR